MNRRKNKFPVIKGKKSNHYPSKPLCPVCKKNKVLEPHSMAMIQGGSALLLDKDDDIWGPSDDMRGYLELGWHGAHDGGEGENREFHAGVRIVYEVQGGQFGLFFCSTTCLRQWLNESVDELEKRIEEESHIKDKIK